MEDVSPEDDLDAVCKMHDECYGDTSDAVAKLPCDKQLVARLAALDADPRNWENPPKTEEDIEYARKYVVFAGYLFRLLINNRELEEKLRDDPEGLIPLMP